MFPVSSAFIAALRSPSMVTSVSVTASNGTTLSVEDGNVQMDSRRSTTRTAELTITPTSSMTANNIYDLVMTPGIEITIKRGLLVNGAVEYVTLGVFLTDTAEYSKATNSAVRWTGSDRSKRISRAKFIDPYKIPSGTALADAGTEFLRHRWPDTVCNFSNVTATIQAQVVYEAGESSDPWASARSLFADHGYDLNYDGYGNVRALPVPDPASTDVVFDFGSGNTNLVTDGNVTGTMEETYNGVVASAETSGAYLPARAIVWDEDPSSPTYILGNMGQVPYFYSSPLLVTQAMCQTAAQTLLNRMKGRLDSFSWPSIVNPALEPLDVVSVTIGGVTNKLVIDSLTIPLKPSDAMTAVARATSVT